MESFLRKKLRAENSGCGLFRQGNECNACALILKKSLWTINTTIISFLTNTGLTDRAHGILRPTKAFFAKACRAAVSAP